MSKRTIGILSILSVMLALVGAGLIVVGVVGSPWTTTTTGNATTAHLTSFANLPLFVARVVIAALALVPHLIAWGRHADHSGALAALGLVCTRVGFPRNCGAAVPDRWSHHACRHGARCNRRAALGATAAAL